MADRIGFADENIRETFWVRYKLKMSDEELLEFSDHLVERDPTYPSWSERELIRDDTRVNSLGFPTSRQVYVMKRPGRFYEAYLEFKKTKR